MSLIESDQHASPIIPTVLYGQAVNSFKIFFIVGIGCGNPFIHAPERHNRIGKFPVPITFNLKTYRNYSTKRLSAFLRAVNCGGIGVSATANGVFTLERYRQGCPWWSGNSAAALPLVMVENNSTPELHGSYIY